jgi:uncharacterized phage protein (TIGR02218 family)
MKPISPTFQAHLDSGATTLAWCWRVSRGDGLRLGFTDHDRPLAFDGTTFEAASGFAASEVRDAVGLAVDNLDVMGALSSASLSEADLAAGLWDDARVEIFRVNWQDPGQRLLMRSGSIGEVRRAGAAFTAEVRGLAHYLQQPKGRMFQRACDADLGDQRCKVALAAPQYRGAGTVTAVESRRRLVASGLGAFEPGWLARGLLTWVSGPNAGRAIEVKRHWAATGGAGLELWLAPFEPVATGHAFTITAGCDKQLSTCRDKFANAANFRGFPHMPGTDFVTSYPNRDDIGNDGASLAGGAG